MQQEVCSTGSNGSRKSCAGSVQAYSSDQTAREADHDGEQDTNAGWTPVPTNKIARRGVLQGANHTRTQESMGSITAQKQLGHGNIAAASKDQTRGGNPQFPSEQ